MSGEFGSYESGYFWYQMDVAAKDLESGELEMTRAWAPFFREFKEIAHAISWAEACDSSESDIINAMLRKLPALRGELEKLSERIETYRRVADDAVRAAIAARQSK